MPDALNDAELAAHLAEVTGKLLIEVRESGMLSLKALGKAGDATANQFLIHAIREQRPDDGLLSEEEKDNPERLSQSRVWIVDPHGVPLYRVQSYAGRMTTNCALTPDGRNLVITESETGAILIAEIPPP